jgi:Spy/CpxP family protein refolding chaperone
MKRSILSLSILLFTFALLSISAMAQDGPPPEDGRMPPPPGMQGPPRQEDERGEILHQLNLTQDQFKSIRKLLGDNGPQVHAAQKDFRDAQDALDDAIYADTVDEALVQALTKRSADAQATLMKLRTANEFAIRRVLTPDQVIKFRELRARQIQLRQERQKERMNGERPNGPGGRKLGRPGQPGMGQPGQPGQQGQPGMQPINNAAPRGGQRRP